jgi:hypothetical protein
VTRPLVLACALTLLALGGVATVAVGQAVRGVVGNGGAPCTDGTVVLQGTAGQAVVGANAGPGFLLGHGFWGYAAAAVVGVPRPPGSGAPASFALGQACPSPARGSVRFALSLPAAGVLRVAVCDAAGREVRGGFSQALAAGSHQLEWHAPITGTGVYFARFTLDGRFIGARRIVLVN